MTRCPWNSPAAKAANTFLQEYPRAYVIPVGSGQRDDAAAARLVQFVIDKHVVVHRAWRPFNLNGQNVGAGSYVVDMRQGKRGLANMLLEVGRDVTQEFDTMYDISAWSHGYLWGATVNRLAQGTLDARALRPVSAASPSGSVAPGNLRTYGLVATSVAGIQAVNFLLDNGVAVSRTPDGMFAVPGSARPLVREAADTYGVAFTNLPPAQGQDATPVSKLRVGSAPRSTRCSPSPGWASTSRPSRTPASTTAATSPATSTRSSSRRPRSTR